MMCACFVSRPVRSSPRSSPGGCDGLTSGSGAHQQDGQCPPAPGGLHGSSDGGALHSGVQALLRAAAGARQEEERALVAVARTLLTVMVTLLNHGRDFDPDSATHHARPATDQSILAVRFSLRLRMRGGEGYVMLPGTGRMWRAMMVIQAAVLSIRATKIGHAGMGIAKQARCAGDGTDEGADIPPWRARRP